MKKSKKKINIFLHNFLKKFFFKSLFRYFIFLRTFKVFKKKIKSEKQFNKFSNKLTQINNYEFKLTSQNNEDGIIEHIFKKIPHQRSFVEIGFGFHEFNSLNLIKNGWSGKLIDISKDESVALETNLAFYFPKSNVNINCSKVTKDNVNFLVNTDNKVIDFFSIDIDGNDYWVLKNLNLKNINVICCEYNHWFGPEKKIVLKYDENFKFTDNGIFGASLLALYELLKSKDFTLIAVESSGTNAFFVKNKFLKYFEPLCPRKNFVSVGRFYNDTKKEELFNNVKKSNLIEELI